MRRREFASLLGGSALATLTAWPAYGNPTEDCSLPSERSDVWAIAAVEGDRRVDTGALCRTTDRLVASSATGRPLDQFAQTSLFEPLGIVGAAWSRFRGDTDAGGGLRLHPRDMAKIGQLVLAGGRWNDRQIVSRDWIDASTAPSVKATDDQSYGYLWWIGRASVHQRQLQWMGALGRGGQSIRIVPALDLVVVVTAGYYQDESPQAFRTQYDVFRNVLRAIPPAPGLSPP